jgi:tRNA (guanine-N7-)-methyltransferase
MGGKPAAKPGEAAIFTPASWTEILPIHTVFDTDRPLEVDVGCGKGRFLAARAAAHPEVNFIGVDRLLVRLRKTGKKLARLNPRNVRLLRIEAAYAVERLLPPDSVTTFYIWFPDPWPKRRHRRRRLFSDAFRDAVHERLKAGGCLHVATDHQDYYREIRNAFARDTRFEPIDPFVPTAEEQTDFERLFMGQGLTIGRASYRKRPDGGSQCSVTSNQ